MVSVEKQKTKLKYIIAMKKKANRSRTVKSFGKGSSVNLVTRRDGKDGGRQKK